MSLSETQWFGLGTVSAEIRKLASPRSHSARATGQAPLGPRAPVPARLSLPVWGRPSPRPCPGALSRSLGQPPRPSQNRSNGSRPSPTRHQALTWKPLACLGPQSLLHLSLSGLSQATGLGVPWRPWGWVSESAPQEEARVRAGGLASGLCGGPIRVTRGGGTGAILWLAGYSSGWWDQTGPGQVPCLSALAAGSGLTVTPSLLLLASPPATSCPRSSRNA